MENPPLFADIPIETSILGDFPASHVWVREGNHNFVDPFFDAHVNQDGWRCISPNKNGHNLS